ncbi:hypothetical protein GBF38_010525, partial [Nibea albiflora]
FLFLQLEPFFKKKFTSYKFLEVLSFRKGSVINEMKLIFESTYVPNNTEIASVLMSAAPHVNGFDIEGSSISVNGISFKLHALGYQPVLFLSHSDWKGQIIRDIIHHVDPAEGVVPGILIKMRKLYECVLKMAKCAVTRGSLQNDMQSCKPAHRIITKVQHGACS